MRSESTPAELLDLDGLPFTEEDREALWKARMDSQRMTTEEYLEFLESFPPREPDREIRGFPGNELEL